MNPPKTVAIIGTVGLPAKYGGFETLAEQLVSFLEKKFRFIVYCSSENYNSRPSHFKSAKLVYIPLSANGIQSVFYDFFSICHALWQADVLLVLGVSGGICLPFIRLFSRKAIIVNLDGIEWKREKWGLPARWFLRISEQLAARFSDHLISDNPEIQRYTSRTYHRDSHLIEYGGDHLALPADLPAQNPDLGRYAFSVCRIEPENNVELILEAFSISPSFRLTFVGNWNNSYYGRTLKTKFMSFPNLSLLDPIYDANSLNSLRRNCFVYIHGHSAGGTNPSLVEAMWLGLPTICFDVQFNRATTANQAKYFKTTRELTTCLEDLSAADLKLLGKRMEVLAKEKYTWARIAQAYSELFSAPSPRKHR